MGSLFLKWGWITVSNIIAEEKGEGRGRFVPKKTLWPRLHRTKGHLWHNMLLLLVSSQLL